MTTFFGWFVAGGLVGLALWPASRWVYRKLSAWSGDTPAA